MPQCKYCGRETTEKRVYCSKVCMQKSLSEQAKKRRNKELLLVTGRPKKFIPLEDIKGLKTLVKEGKSQDEISNYFKSHGIDVDQVTISRRIKDLVN